MRDVLAHDYLQVDLGRVWNIVKEELPDLKAAVAWKLSGERGDGGGSGGGGVRLKDPTQPSEIDVSLLTMNAEDHRLAEVRDADGCEVVLLTRIWQEKIMRDHPELADYQQEVMETVQRPNHDEPDPREGRRCFYRRGVGPSEWLLVVVSYEQTPARIITALALRKDPTRWKP